MCPSRPVLEEPAADDPASEELKALLASTTGNVQLSVAGSRVLETVRRRLLHLGLPSTGAYLELLKQKDAGGLELDCLIAELTVGETFFFRHAEQFESLRDYVLPACLKRNEGSRRLRIWSAGCANGAEAYSIAILVNAALGHRIEDWDVSIIGSDINRAFLAEAETGSYSDWALRGLEEEQTRSFFERSGKRWSIRGRYKEHVRFIHHNLISDELPSLNKGLFDLDIVFCRNVMIYFEQSASARLIRQLGATLERDGWLFVGPTDFNPQLNASFVPEKLPGGYVHRVRPAQAASVEGPAAGRAAASPPPRVDTRASSKARSRPEKRGAPRRGTLAVTGRSAGRASPGPAAPRRLPRPDIGMVVELANRGDWDNTLRRCQELLDADSCNAPAYYYRALALQASGEPAEAEASLRRAIYLDRDFALAHYQLGLARRDARDLAACARAFRNALEALSGIADDQPISPCGELRVLDLRQVTRQQLELLGER